MRDRFFYVACLGFTLGILLRSFIFINLYAALWVGMVSFLLILFFVLLFRKSEGSEARTNSVMAEFVPLESTDGTPKWCIAFCLFVLALSLGVARFGAADRPGVFESEAGRLVSFSGILVDAPDVREGNQKLVVEAREGDRKSKMLVTVPLGKYFSHGDKVQLSGILRNPENFVTDQGKVFDYVNYLRKDGIFYLMNYPEVEIVSRGHGSPVKRVLFSAKEKFSEKVRLSVREPESVLLEGLILGERSSFGAEMRKKFVDTGTIHIVALSGYNISLVADWVMKIFSFLPKNLGLGFGGLSIVLFVAMTGGSATAVRAGIMAVLAILARASGRGYEAGRGLLLAGIAMTLINPFILRYDVSFQLSFLATFALIFVTPKIEKYFLWVTPRFKLREILSVTTAAYLFVLPFILYKMGNLSLVALPANFLVLPLVPPAMILGFAAGFAGLVSHALAVPVGLVAELFLRYELGVVDILARIPFASVPVPDFPLFLTVLIYACFFYRLFGKRLKDFFSDFFKQRR